MSGAHKTRRAKFLSLHPRCCFCGGDVPTETEDHVPARGMFFGRRWPEGFVFPACGPCNHSASFDEMLMAWTCKVRLGPYTAVEEREFGKACHEVARRAPDLWKAIVPHSRVETRNLLSKVRSRDDLARVADVLHSVALPEALFDAAERYGRKLAKALHYRHTSQIVPRDGVVKVRSFTNSEALTDEFPRDFVAVLGGRPEIRREKDYLDGQFTYRYAIAEGGAASAFAIVLGESLVILTAVFPDRNRFHSRNTPPTEGE